MIDGHSLIARSLLAHCSLVFAHLVHAARAGHDGISDVNLNFTGFLFAGLEGVVVGIPNTTLR